MIRGLEHHRKERLRELACLARRLSVDHIIAFQYLTRRDGEAAFYQGL